MIDNVMVNAQSSIRIQGRNCVVYFDPYEITEDRHDADTVFLTHDHPDHFSPADIGQVKKEDTLLIVPKNMYEKALDQSGISKDNIIAVNPGQIKEIVGGKIIETVPAYNRRRLVHPKRAGWCGYLISVDDVRYYVAGDTDALVENYRINCDVALVPIGGKYTMNVKDAAVLINQIRPQYVIPTTYDKTELIERFQTNVDERVKIEIKLPY